MQAGEEVNSDSSVFGFHFSIFPVAVLHPLHLIVRFFYAIVFLVFLCRRRVLCLRFRGKRFRGDC